MALRTRALIGLIGFSVALSGCQAYQDGTITPRSAERAANPPRVLIVLTSHAELGDTGRATGFHFSEMTHPFWVFHEAGYIIDFASPAGGAAPMTAADRSDPQNARFLDNPRLVAAIENTQQLSTLDPARYDAIYFAGGHGTMWDFPDDPGVQRVTAAIYEQGGVVGAVCHGPAALVNVRLSDGSYLVANHHVSAFTNAEEEAVELGDTVPFLLADKLEARGARHAAGENFERFVIADGRLVTGQNPASARGVAQAMVAAIAAERRN